MDNIVDLTNMNEQKFWRHKTLSVDRKYSKSRPTYLNDQKLSTDNRQKSETVFINSQVHTR